MSDTTVLVTGGSGFVGSHCIVQLLEAGHRVRTTVRSLSRENEVRAMVARGGVDAGERLSFVAADLERDDGWADAVSGCRYVLHVASPFPAGEPKHEDELIVPAREGALRVLRAARAADVERVVLTSSFAAIGYGHGKDAPHSFDETTWSNANSPTIAAYPKSKTLAERAAWDYVNGEGKGLSLSVVNPVGVFGPVLAKDYSTSIVLVKRLLDGSMPGVPKLWFGVVDVRDVASLHLLAMTSPAAGGERFLAVTGDFLSMAEIARALKDGMGDAGRKVPTRELPSWLVRLAALRDPALKLLTPELGRRKTASSAKAQRLLGWKPRSAAEALVASGKSLVELGLVK